MVLPQSSRTDIFSSAEAMEPSTCQTVHYAFIAHSVRWTHNYALLEYKLLENYPETNLSNVLTAFKSLFPCSPQDSLNPLGLKSILLHGY